MSPSDAFRDAPAPFSSIQEGNGFSYPADFILRSSDGFDFHVHRELLKLVSDCFEGMFTVSSDVKESSGTNSDSKQSESGSDSQLHRDGKPVVVVDESSRVLYKLLTLAYPIGSRSLLSLSRSTDLNDVTATFRAAQKYQFLRIPAVLEQMLDKQTLVAAQPYRMFAIARICGLDSLARKAAIGTLTAGAEALNVTFPEMKMLTWDDAHKINKFRQQCCEEASDCARAVSRIHPRSSLGEKELNRLINPHTKKDYVWWTEKGHSDECSGKYTTSNTNGYIVSMPTSEKKKRTSIFSRAPHAPQVLEPRAMWFRNHISRLQLCLAAVPTNVTLALSAGEKAVINGCRLCANQAESDLESLRCVLTEAIDGEHWKLAEATF